MDGFEYSPKPPKAVTDYLRLKKITPSFDWRDVSPEDHAFGFTAAKAMQINVLTTLKESLEKRQAEGIPYKQWAKELEPKLKELGWWGTVDMRDPKTDKIVPARLGSPRRLKMIYWANTRTARAAGQWERIQKTKKLLPYLLYQLGPSENHRPHHQDKQGLMAPIDDPIWKEWFTPNGWGCKCFLRQIGPTEAKRLGWPGKKMPGSIPRDEYVNKRNGEVSTIPRGIDPGWNSNPGLVRAENTRKFLADDFDQAPLDLARIAIADYVRDSEFKAMMLGERPDKFAIPIARLPENIAKQFGTSTRTIIVSSGTLKTHNAFRNPKYPPPEEWAAIMAAMESAEMYLQDGGKVIHMFFKHTGDIKTKTEIYRAKFTRTIDGKEIFLSTFHAWRIGKPKQGKLMR